MARLPQPGQDNGVWGDILNEYLSEIHTSTGFLKNGVVVESQLSSDVQTKLNASSGPVMSNDIVDATATGKSLLTAVNVVSAKTVLNLANVDNTTDANKPVSSATQTALNLKANTSALATVATSGNYNDLSNRPIIPTVTGTNTGDQTLSIVGTNLTISGANGNTVALPGGGGAVSSVNTQTGAVVLDADDISDATTTKKFITASDLSKLAAIEAGAEVNNISDSNATDLTDAGDSTLHYHASDRNRANHTGTQTASTISDFNTAADARVSAVVTTERTEAAALTNKDLTSGTNTFPTFNQSTTGSAATLTTARTVQTNLASTTAVSFDGSANVTAGVTGLLPVANGGTGANNLTGIVVGNGTAAFTTATAGIDYVTPNGVETLTNKRVTPRVTTNASDAAPSINTDTVGTYGITALSVDITSFSTNLTGTPTDGQRLWIYIVATATHALTWGASFEAGPSALPVTTIGTTRLDVGFIWNAATSKWRCVAAG